MTGDAKNSTRLRRDYVIETMRQAAICFNHGEGLRAQLFAAMPERIGKGPVRQTLKPGRTHIDLAVYEAGLVPDGKVLGFQHAKSRDGQMIRNPLGGVLAVRPLSRQCKAGITEAADFPDQLSRRSVGLGRYVRLQPHDVEPPAGQLSQAREKVG